MLLVSAESGRPFGYGRAAAFDPLLTSESTSIHFTFSKTSRIGPLTDVSVVPIE